MTTANMAINSSQLRDFQVRLDSGQTINERIENIRELTDVIRIYGRHIICFITFYFHDSHHHAHSLTLRNSGHNDKFVVEFYHYYSPNFNRIELTDQQKIHDFEIVMNCLQQNNLDSRLIRHIIHPFHTQTVIS
jgi:hypothetical protein